MVNPRLTEIIVSKNETKYRKSTFPDISKVVNKNPLCTSCNKSVKLNVINGKALVHPQLQTLLCEKCHQFYGDGEFSVDEDGSDKYCRWCGQGGTIFQCSNCVAGFCKKCIKRNLTRAILDEVDRDDWLCFVCNVEPLWELRAMAWAALKHSENIKPPPSSTPKAAPDNKPKVSPLLKKHVKMVTHDLHTIAGDIQTFGKELKKECDRIYDEKCRQKVIVEALSKEEEAMDALSAFLKNSQDQLKGIQDKLDGFYKVWSTSREQLQVKIQAESSTTNEVVSSTSEIAPAPTDDSSSICPPEENKEKIEEETPDETIAENEDSEISSEKNNSSLKIDCSEVKDSNITVNDNDNTSSTNHKESTPKNEQVDDNSQEKKRKKSEETDGNKGDEEHQEESCPAVTPKKMKLLPSKLPSKEEKNEENGNIEEDHMETENGTNEKLVEAV